MGLGMSGRGNLQPDTLRISGLLEPDHCALLVQELQNGVVGVNSGLQALAEAAVAVDLAKNASKVVRAARTAGATVIHCTAENLPGGFGVNLNARLFEMARRM